jgi:hypothetical protein
MGKEAQEQGMGGEDILPAYLGNLWKKAKQKREEDRK